MFIFERVSTQTGEGGREGEREGERGRERERGSEAGCVLSAQSSVWGSNSQSMKS